MPCCGSVGGCGARAVSRKTPIYFIQQLYVIEKSEYIIWVLPIGKGGRGTLPKRGGGVKSYVGNALYWKHQLGKVRNKDLNKDFPKKN